MYRGAATVAALVGALAALRPEGGMEVVLVNDGSPDDSAEVCRELVAAAPMPIVYIEHARNYGEHNAVMTGLRHAAGGHVITMDDDLQNPPEEVVRLYDHARLGGWDVVYTRYAEKQHAALAQPGQPLRQLGGGPAAGQAARALSELVPLHVGTGGAKRDALSAVRIRMSTGCSCR